MISLLAPLQVDKKLFKEDQKLKGAGQTAPTAAQSIKRERAKYRASREPTITQGTLVTLQDFMLQKAIQKQEAKKGLNRRPPASG